MHENIPTIFWSKDSTWQSLLKVYLNEINILGQHVIYFVPVDNEFVILLLNIFIFYFICTLE